MNRNAIAVKYRVSPRCTGFGAATLVTANFELGPVAAPLRLVHGIERRGQRRDGILGRSIRW